MLPDLPVFFFCCAVGAAVVWWHSWLEQERLVHRCIIDRKRRQFDAENCRLLCNFAEVVVQEILKFDARVWPSITTLCVRSIV